MNNNEPNELLIFLVALPVFLVVAAVTVAIIVGVILLLASFSPVLAGIFLGYVIFRGIHKVIDGIGDRYNLP